MTSGFTKITFSNNSKDLNQEQMRYRKKNKSGSIIKILSAIFIILFILIIILSSLVFITGQNLYRSIQKTSIVAKEAYTAIKNQDIETARVKLKDLDDNMLQVQSNVFKLNWLKYIPWVGSYVNDLNHAVTGSTAGVEAVRIAIDTIAPYADLLGFKGKSTFVAQSADERIKTAVDTLDKITPKFDEIAQKIDITGKELEQIDENRYPENIGKYQIKKTIKGYKDIFSQTAKLFIDAQPLLKNLPEVLGNKSPKVYLVIFQNDAELRATGGFITGYALFKIDKGKMQVIKSDDIYKLDAQKTKTFSAPEAILNYHLNVKSLELRDSNLSPDYVESMKKFESLISESVPDFPHFDGIIAVDTHVLVNAIKILGDFNVYGRVFSADNDKRCDCPKAIYELEDYSTKPVAYVREERKDIIGVLLYQIMQKALGISPSKYWGKLMQMIYTESGQRHILYYFHDSNAQKGIEALNYAGRILPFDGDYLDIVDVNFAGAKSNMFVKESVKQEVNISSDKSIEETITISYKNPSPPSNCNLEAGQLCLNGILRNWLRIYLPEGSILIQFTGSEKKTITYDELGKTVFEGFLTVKPQGAAEVIIKYKLPFKIKGGESYKLLIQKQPGKDNPEYILTVNNHQVDKFTLLMDKIISSRF